MSPPAATAPRSVTLGSDALLRLTLLAGLATAQLTLLLRADQGGFAIQASLVWIGGGLLLLEREEERRTAPLAGLKDRRLLAALVLMAWALLVLSRVGRLYDPLLHLVPLAALVALGLMAGLPPRSRAGLGLVLIGALLPAQVLINRWLPTDPLAWLTARAGAQLLWAGGTPAYAIADRILLPERLMIVNRSCTGLDTITLCLAAVVILTILLPPRWAGLPLWPTVAGVGAASMLLALLVNAVRVALLGLVAWGPPPGGWERLGHFDFWHAGGGSHLFSLVAMLLACGAYLLTLEVGRRARLRGRPLP